MPGDGYDLSENLELFGNQLPPGLLPVAQDPGGNLICLRVDAQDIGRVYFWSPENASSSDEDGNTESLYEVAEVWDSFIRSLRLRDQAISS